MLENLIQFDTSLFLWLNGKHNTVMDVIMWWISNRFIWSPLYLLFFYLILKKYGKQAWLFILFAVLAVVATDQGTNLVKFAVERFRPTNTPDIASLVHVVNGYRGGDYGFFSGHSSNSFMFATFMVMLFRRDYKWVTPLLFCWAVMVAYSRIYLGVHFPLDIICGALYGVMIGMLFSYVAMLIYKKYGYA